MTKKEKEDITRAAQTAGAHPLADDFHDAVMAEWRRMAGEEEDNAVTYLVRHGATELNKEAGGKDRIRGWLDVPLTKLGQQEAEKAADALKNKNISLIVTSDLKRAAETAEIISERIGAPIKKDKNFRPWHLGPTIEGKPTDTVWPEVEALVKSPEIVPPGGESFNVFKDRFLTAFELIQSSHPDNNIAIVFHYRNLRLIHAWQEAGAEGHKIDSKEFLRKADEDKPACVQAIDKAGKNLEGETPCEEKEEPSIEIEPRQMRK